MQANTEQADNSTVRALVVLFEPCSMVPPTFSTASLRALALARPG